MSTSRLTRRTRRSLITFGLAATVPALAQMQSLQGNQSRCPLCKVSNSQPGAQLLMVDANDAPVAVPGVVTIICSKCGIVYTVTA